MTNNGAARDAIESHPRGVDGSETRPPLGTRA